MGYTPDFIPNKRAVVELLRQRLATGQAVTLTLSSNSMAPLFRVGDEVQIKAIGFDKLQLGDIITLETENGLLTHRLHSINQRHGNDQFITKGDRNRAFDLPNPGGNILGVVISGRSQRRRSVNLTYGRGQFINQTLFRLSKAEILICKRYLGFNTARNKTYILYVLFYGLARMVTLPLMI